jgi:hypothetical protein
MVVVGRARGEGWRRGRREERKRRGLLGGGIRFKIWRK